MIELHLMHDIFQTLFKNSNYDLSLFSVKEIQAPLRSPVSRCASQPGFQEKACGLKSSRLTMLALLPVARMTNKPCFSA